MRRLTFFICVAIWGCGIQGCSQVSSLVGERPASTKVPVVEREQNVDFRFVEEIVASTRQREYRYVRELCRFAPPAGCIADLESSRALRPGCRKDRRVVEADLAALEGSHPNLAALFDQIINPAVDAYSARQVPQEICNRYYHFLTPQGKDSLQVLVLETDGAETMSARYFPEGIIALLGVQDKRIAADPGYRAQVGFLLGHELGHAIALHSLEDQTSAQKAAGFMEHFSATQTDTQIDKLYGQLDAKTAEIVNRVAVDLSPAVLRPEDSVGTKRGG